MYVHVQHCVCIHCIITCMNNFHRDSDGKIKKEINPRLQKDQGCCLSSNVRLRNAQPYPRLVSLYSVRVWTLSGDGAPCVLNFSGQKSLRDVGTVVSAHYDNSLGQD